MPYILLFFFILLFNQQFLLAENKPMVSISAKDLQFKCSGTNSDQILIITKQNKRIVKFPYFFSTRLINKSLVCQKFEEYLKATNWDFDMQLEEVIDPNGEKVFQDITNNLLSKCLEAGLCYRTFLDLPLINPNLLNCHENLTFARLLEKAKPKQKIKSIKTIHDLQIKAHPEFPLSNITLEYLNDRTVNDLYLSTMSLGNFSLTQFINAARNGNNKNIYFNYDLGIVLPELQTRALLFSTNQIERFFQIPNFGGQDFEMAYHLKFIASPQKNTSILSSMNFASSAKTNYIDFSYAFEDLGIRDELISLSERNQQRFCASKEDYTCLSNLIVDSQESQHKALKEIYRKSCQVLPASHYKSSGYLFLSELGNSEDFIIDKINQAKFELVLLVSQITNKNIYQALKLAQDRGVKVYLSSANYSGQFNSTFDFYYPNVNSKDTWTLIPHMKVMVIDRKLMVFGTGNFSINGLRHNSEVFAQTDNPDAIKTVYDYLAVFAQNANPSLARAVSPEHKKLNYLVWGNVTDPEMHGTEKFTESHLQNYRRFNQTGIQYIEKCRLNHLLFISKRNYKACLSQN